MGLGDNSGSELATITLCDFTKSMQHNAPQSKDQLTESYRLLAVPMWISFAWKINNAERGNERERNQQRR